MVGQWLYPPQEVPEVPVAPAPVDAVNPTPQLQERPTVIYHPSLQQLRLAATHFQQLAKYYGISYAFVGSFLASEKGFRNFPVEELEILVDPRTVQTNYAIFSRILQSRPDHMAYIETGHWIIIVDEARRGISLRILPFGTSYYPTSFFSMATPNNNGREEVVYQHNLGFPYPQNTRHQVPFLLSRLCLEQRLLRWMDHVNDPTNLTQNDSDRYDIKALLRATAADYDLPFSAGRAHELLPIVKRWIDHADDQGIETTWYDLNAWRRLGLNLGDQWVRLPIGNPPANASSNGLCM